MRKITAHVTYVSVYISIWGSLLFRDVLKFSEKRK